MQPLLLNLPSRGLSWRTLRRTPEADAGRGHAGEQRSHSGGGASPDWVLWKGHAEFWWSHPTVHPQELPTPHWAHTAGKPATPLTQPFLVNMSLHRDRWPQKIHDHEKRKHMMSMLTKSGLKSCVYSGIGCIGYDRVKGQATKFPKSREFIWRVPW